jgi:hypothetical protein
MEMTRSSQSPRDRILWILIKHGSEPGRPPEEWVSQWFVPHNKNQNLFQGGVSRKFLESMD